MYFIIYYNNLKMDTYIYIIIALTFLYIYLYEYNVDHIYYFYSDSCKYCKIVEPEFNKAQAIIGNMGYKYHTIDILKEENMKLCKALSIKTVPTIMKVNFDNNVYKYLGNRKTDDIIKWIAPK